MKTKQLLYGALRWVAASPVPRVFRFRYGGVGTILALHNVTLGREPALSFVQDQNLSATFLETLIERYHARGYDIVSLDEVRERVRLGRHGRRFVAFTFDDGYRSNFDIAFPIFAKYGVPFAVYVATDLIDGKCLPWPQALQELLFARDQLEVDFGRTTVSFALTSHAARTAAMDAIAGHVDGLPVFAREDWLRELFVAQGIDLAQLTRKHMLSWDMIRELARSDIATVGAHSVAHVPLLRLPHDRMRHEMTASRQRIEDETGVAVQHFSYPFGGFAQAGTREFACARDTGFATAVTTRSANVFSEHRDALWALPRQVVSGSVEDPAIVDVLDSGLASAMLYGFRRVVTSHGGLKKYL